MQKFILVDNKAALADAWRKEFDGHRNFEVHGPADIFSLEGDACVSPANSFGFMDGGIDLLYSMNMGWHVMHRIQDRIRTEFDGELLVGQALMVETGYARFPNMICAPTMRVPARLIGTPNVYLAAKAMFLLAKRHPVLQTIVCPGLGTGTGGVSPEECARLMHLAYHDWYLGEAEDNGTLRPDTLGKVFQLGSQHSVKHDPPQDAPKSSLRDLHGIWKDNPVTLEQIREQAWGRKCTCEDGTIECPACKDVDDKKQKVNCAGCKGKGRVTCGKCGGLNNE